MDVGEAGRVVVIQLPVVEADDWAAVGPEQICEPGYAPFGSV